MKMTHLFLSVPLMKMGTQERTHTCSPHWGLGWTRVHLVLLGPHWWMVRTSLPWIWGYPSFTTTPNPTLLQSRIYNTRVVSSHPLACFTTYLSE
jgi:hypothetical protein